VRDKGSESQIPGKRTTAIAAVLYPMKHRGALWVPRPQLGTAHYDNLQTYPGTLPKALLNNPIPNPCYITGTFAATTTALPMCSFKVRSAANIAYIKVFSTTVPSCSVAPIVTITDGTASETVTLTKSQWNTSLDVSAGANTTIFSPTERSVLHTGGLARPHQPTSGCHIILHRF